MYIKPKLTTIIILPIYIHNELPYIKRKLTNTVYYKLINERFSRNLMRISLFGIFISTC